MRPPTLAPSVLQWRDQVAAGKLRGPNIFTSGPKLEGYKPLWKGTIEVGTPAEVDAALDRLQAMKVDFVKITDNTLKPDIFLYALGAARKRGLKTSAHTPFALTIEQAATAGLSSVEHIDYLIKAGSPKETTDRRGLCGRHAQLRRCFGPVRRNIRRSLRPARLPPAGSDRARVSPTLNMGRIIAYLDREDHQARSGARVDRAWPAQDLRMAGRARGQGHSGANRRPPPRI